jgi:nitrate/nitrite transporter NarK
LGYAGNIPAEAAAAVAIGLINSVGNLGGFFGPYIVGYLDKQTGSHYSGILYLSASALIAATLALTLRKVGLKRAIAE